MLSLRARPLALFASLACLALACSGLACSGSDALPDDGVDAQVDATQDDGPSLDATTDAAPDTRGIDGTAPDTATAADTRAPDTSIVIDTALADSADTSDAAKLDSALADTSPLDTAIADTTVPDTARPDTAVASDTSATCVAAYFGSCVTRRTSDSAVTTCRDYYLSPGYPGSSTYPSACAASSSALTRTWQTSPCPHATSVGGCNADSSGGGLCFAQTDWYYPPDTESGAHSVCVAAGRTWLAP